MRFLTITSSVGVQIQIALKYPDVEIIYVTLSVGVWIENYYLGDVDYQISRRSQRGSVN